RDVSEDITSIINIVRKKPRKIVIYTAPGWKHTVYHDILGMASSPDRIIPAIMKSPEGRKHGKDALRFAQKLSENTSRLGDILTEKEEFDALNDAALFLGKEFKCKVQIIQSYKSDSQKALRSEPGKPGIEVIT
ncbi:MAG: hypothetical protein KAT35_01050, partial [Candidatus Aenigmarchaeota archaeon]|nr:hypothetical protein [Candidatus Aenigmarchaeota archaeon]